MDSFSRWMEEYLVPNTQAKRVTEKVALEFILRFGVLFQIKSEKGGQVDCELIREMCKISYVNHQMFTPLHPQGNSRAERMVKVVKNFISPFCKTYCEWDQNFSLLILMFRTTVHEVITFTPSFVMTR